MKYYPRWKPGKPCPNNEGVICSDHSKCSLCGWNPTVAEKRTADMKKKRRSTKKS